MEELTWRYFVNVYLALIIMVNIVIPACIYYYESDDEWSCVNKDII